jgi:hypothetical protein
MYDHELSVAIQQERERAIREARLHHRVDVVSGPSMRTRLLATLRSIARRPVAAGVQGPARGTALPGPHSVPGALRPSHPCSTNTAPG